MPTNGSKLVVVIALAAIFATVLFPPLARTDSSSLRQEFLKRLVAAAIERTHHPVRYDSSYVGIPYPGGDVPADTGVCTDEVIRAYRAVGVDLQKEVHEDMKHNFSAYSRAGSTRATRPDANIDHRRVPVLMLFFARHGEVLKITESDGGLRSRRSGHVGPRRKYDAHRDRCEPKVGGKWALSGRPQHRAGPQDGRCAVRLEDHRALSLLRAAAVTSRLPASFKSITFACH